jgi:DNA repair protein RadC
MIRLTKFDVRLVKESGKNYDFDGKTINSSSRAASIIDSVLNISNATQEIFGIVTLDIQKNVTGIFEVTKGIIDESVVHPREVFQRAILQNAHSILLFYNHPGGSRKPSNSDIKTTNRLSESAKILGIEILDHIIIVQNGYTSFREEGYM